MTRAILSISQNLLLRKLLHRHQIAAAFAFSLMLCADAVAQVERPVEPPANEKTAVTLRTVEDNLRTQDYQTALDLLDRILRQDPENEAALAYLSYIRAVQGEDGQVRDTLDRLHKIQLDRAASQIRDDSRNLELRLRYAESLLHVGDIDGAKAQFEQVLATEPANAVALAALRGIHLRSGDKAAAEKLMLQIQDLRSKNPRAFDGLIQEEGVPCANETPTTRR
jgi:tetratricopeptide (TPR) repeat protein